MAKVLCVWGGHVQLVELELVAPDLPVAVVGCQGTEELRILTKGSSSLGSLHLDLLCGVVLNPSQELPHIVRGLASLERFLVHGLGDLVLEAMKECFVLGLQLLPVPLNGTLHSDAHMGVPLMAVVTDVDAPAARSSSQLVVPGKGKPRNSKFKFRIQIDKFQIQNYKFQI